MSYTATHTIARLIRTGSANDTVYGIADDNRVFAAHEPGGSAAPSWLPFGFLTNDVRLGHPLHVVVDDVFVTTSPVISQKVPSRPILVD